MRNYRIAKKDDLYYPQVQELSPGIKIFGVSIFRQWGPWQKIGVHNGGGFGLYQSDDFSYGRTLIEAEDILCRYEKSLMSKEPPTFYYYDQVIVRYKIIKRENPKPVYVVPEEITNKITS